MKNFLLSILLICLSINLTSCNEKKGRNNLKIYEPVHPKHFH